MLHRRIHLSPVALIVTAYMVLGLFILYLSFNLMQGENLAANNATPVKEKVVVLRDWRDVVSMHLFGVHALNRQKLSDRHIELVGIIFKGENSEAVMLINDKEKILKEGEKIDDKYTISQIDKSRVIFATPTGPQEIELFAKNPKKVQSQSQNTPLNGFNAIQEPENGSPVSNEELTDGVGLKRPR